jgi:hypothetical protein
MTLYLEYLIWAVCDADLHPLARRSAEDALAEYLYEQGIDLDTIGRD